MLLNTLIKNLKTVISSIEVKMPYTAKSHESVQSLQLSGEFISAKEDIYEEDPVRREMNKSIINNYNELNDYYRKLMGLPPINTDKDDFIRVTKNQYIESGITDLSQFINDASEYVLPMANIYNPDSYIMVETIRGGINNNIHISTNDDGNVVLKVKLSYNIKNINFIDVDKDNSAGYAYSLNLLDYDISISGSTVIITSHLSDDSISYYNFDLYSTFVKIGYTTDFINEDNIPFNKSNIPLDVRAMLDNDYLIYDSNGILKPSLTKTDYLRILTKEDANITIGNISENQVLQFVINTETNTNNDDYGILPMIYIHNEKNNDNIYKLEKSGLFDKFKKSYPDMSYLNYKGYSNEIDVYTARTAGNFDIIRISKKDVPEPFFNRFVTIYEECRSYFSIAIYNSELSGEYNLYENFIGMSIMVMTIHRMLANSFKSGIERDFYDWDFIQKFYKSYGVPFLEDLPMEYHLSILKNLNNLLRNKSTDKVLVDLVELLGYRDLEILRYFLVRKHKTDPSGHPIFKFTDDGKIDYKNMYEVYFQAIGIHDKNIPMDIDDSMNKYTYNEVTENDPYWVEDNVVDKSKYGIGVGVFDDVFGTPYTPDDDEYDMAYNYIETKYIGISSLYNMTEIFFEFIYAYNMMLNKKSDIDKMQDALITIPKIDATVSEYPLVDIIIFLMSLLMKLRNVDIDQSIIPALPSQVSSIYGFNFDVVIETVKALRDKLSIMQGIYNPNYESFKMIGNEIVKLNELIYRLETNLPIFENDTVNKLDIIYTEIKEFLSFLETKMANAQTIEEYDRYRDIYRIVSVSGIQEKLFTYNKQGTTNVYTYGGYLQDKQPILYDIINELDNSANINTAIQHTTSQLNKLVTTLEYTHVMRNEQDPVLKTLIALIKFFKSYTVDLRNHNIIFIFDSKADNTVNLFDKIARIIKSEIYNESFNGAYFDEIDHMLISKYYKDGLNGLFRDFIYYIKTYLIHDEKYRILEDVISFMIKNTEYMDTLNALFFDELNKMDIAKFFKDTLSPLIKDKLNIISGHIKAESEQIENTDELNYTSKNINYNDSLNALFFDEKIIIYDSTNE